MVFWVGKTINKDAFLPQIIYNFNAISIEIAMGFLGVLRQMCHDAW